MHISKHVWGWLCPVPTYVEEHTRSRQALVSRSISMHRVARTHVTVFSNYRQNVAFFGEECSDVNLGRGLPGWQEKNKTPFCSIFLTWEELSVNFRPEREPGLEFKTNTEREAVPQIRKEGEKREKCRLLKIETGKEFPINYEKVQLGFSLWLSLPLFSTEI